LARRGWQWAGFPTPLADWSLIADVLYRSFDRGFITRLRLTSGTLWRLVSAQLLFRTQPIGEIAFEVGSVCEASLVDVRRLLPLPWPVRASITWRGGSGDSAGFAITLLGSPVLSTARELTVERFTAGRSGWLLICRLTRSPFLQALRVLRVSACALGDAEAMDIARCPQFVELEELSLSGNRIASAGVMALIHSPHLRNLKKLDMTRNTLSASDKVELRDRFGEGVAM
jgi:hypothetical protein